MCLRWTHDGINGRFKFRDTRPIMDLVEVRDFPNGISASWARWTIGVPPDGQSFLETAVAAAPPAPGIPLPPARNS